MSKDKVVFLRKENLNTNLDVTVYLSCVNCSNKSWIVTFDGKDQGFPRLKCSCCGFDAGQFGWLTDD